MPAILLVSCYELGHQPLAVAGPAAHLRRAGLPAEVETLDVSIDGLDLDRLARARLVAISVPMHTALRLGVEVARRTREVNPGAHVVFHGLYAHLNADWLLEEVADAVLGGEVETALVDLARRVLAGEAASAPARQVRIERISYLPPDRTGLPDLDRYARLEVDGETRTAGAVEASRGCKHLCRHCPIPPVYGGRFFAVPVDVVLADVRALVESGARHVTFADPDFLNGPTHARRVARALHEAFHDLTFDFTAKIEHLRRHRDLLPGFAAAGCLFVVSAAESLSGLVLERLAKNHTRDDFEAALAACREAGIALRPTFVAFTPWTTLEDHLELLDFVAAHDLAGAVDPVQFTLRLLVPPGSALLADPTLRPHLGPLVPESFGHEWTHPDPRMDDLARRSTEIVQEAVESGEDPAETFQRLRAAADETAGRRVPRLALPGPTRAPRITEPWFC